MRNSCTLCGCNVVQPLVRLRDLTVGRCPQCGSGLVIELDSELGDERHADEYSANYQRDRLEDKADRCWDLVLEHTGDLREVRSVLDIGCGEGDFLDLAKAAGLHTAGVDIARCATKVAAGKGHEVLCQSATAPFPAELQFDLIVMWDLLEHLAHPRQALEHAFEVLAPNGRMYIITPKIGSVYDRLGILLHRLSFGRFEQLVCMCWRPHHLFRFHPKGIAAVMRSIGFAECAVKPLQLLSLRPECYASGVLLPKWTGRPTIDRCISLTGVRIAKLFHIHNKILIVARRGSA